MTRTPSFILDDLLWYPFVGKEQERHEHVESERPSEGGLGNTVYELALVRHGRFELLLG